LLISELKLLKDNSYNSRDKKLFNMSEYEVSETSVAGALAHSGSLEGLQEPLGSDSDQQPDGTEGVDLHRLKRLNQGYIDVVKCARNWLVGQHVYHKDCEVRWFYIVAKPYDKHYVAKAKLYQKDCMDYIRKKLIKKYNILSYFMTKETEATKTHVNILCTSTEDLSLLDGAQARFYYTVQEIDTCDHMDKNLINILIYCIKESKTRKFSRHSDFIHSKF